MQGDPSPRYDRDDRPDVDDDYDYRRRRDYDRPYGQKQDEDHLRILGILYFVLGGLTLLFSLFPLIYVVLGVVMVSGGMGVPDSRGGPPAFLGWALIGGGGAISLMMIALASLKLFAGYSLLKHKHYMVCFVAACLACLQMPYGTLLGVFTIIVLVRPGVKEMFSAAAPLPPTALEK